jgi:CHAT domain-containing protein
LQRAFLIAGAPTLVVSLWRVSDRATVALMVEFYRRILGGESCAGALDAARRKLRNTYPHPGIWGPFVLVGNPVLWTRFLQALPKSLRPYTVAER